jgi:putative transposase
MPWKETSPVEQRERFILDHRLDLYATAELCARYGISRKTGYKWLALRGGRPPRAARSQPRAASVSAPHCARRIGAKQGTAVTKSCRMAE